MFEQARIKLTAWYLAIIMAISLGFTVIIFAGVNRELVRFDNLQKARSQRTDQINIFLRANGLPIPPEVQSVDNESIENARLRIISALTFINLSILVIAGLGGYFLAGITLDPIKKNMDEQKVFISDASHELRTPLTSLKTEIEVALRDKKLNMTQTKELLKSNLQDVDKMQKLANYLLAVNRYESQKHLDIDNVDLKEIAISAIGKKNIKTELSNSVVKGNFDSLVELTSILIDNAIKYGRGKEISVTVKNKKIIISDNGVGISQEDLPHIFDRFYRSDKSRGTEGYGLGLSIAKSISDANHAKIFVSSKPQKGSVFTVAFS